MIVASARDVDAAVQEIRTWGKSKWAVAVMPLVTKDVPADHPSLEPIWNECVEHDLPVAHHSFTWTPPYFPGVFDLWDNIFLGRLASHPWGAMRFIASVIGGGIMDRHPKLRVGILECGFGWLPFWGRRMNEQYEYVGSCAKLKHHPEDYLKSGRFFCSIERHEGEDMFNSVTGFLGDDVLMYASDYPHPECQFPEHGVEHPRLEEPQAGDAAEAAVGQRPPVLQANVSGGNVTSLHGRPRRPGTGLVKLPRS